MQISKNLKSGNATLKMAMGASLSAALFLLLFSCARQETLITQSEFLMDTIVEIKIPDNQASSGMEEAFEAAFGEIRRIYKKYNAHSADSLISKINSSARYKLDEETKNLILYAIKISSISEGAFDPTLLNLMENVWWPILNGKIQTPPPPKKIHQILKSVGMGKIKLEGDVLLKPRNMGLDFGAFVKGYAVDRAAAVLKKHNVKTALVNAGGDLICYGKKKWRIAIKHPRSEERKKPYLGVITLSERAVATSGDYERFVVLDGKRYHHIINPADGMPAGNSISATIIAQSCMEADALSTAVFVGGTESGKKILENYSMGNKQGIEGFIVDVSGKFFMTDGFKKFKLVF